MEYKIFSVVNQIVFFVFNYETDYFEKELPDFGRFLMDIELQFRDEISDNLYEIVGYHNKEILIKKYLVSIGEIYDNILFVALYSDDESENEHLLPEKYFNEIKDFYQSIIDIICEECFKNRIDLNKIDNESGYLSKKLNFQYYHDKINSEQFLLNESDNNFIKIFTSNLAYELYTYLIYNFKTADLVKHSCIYRKMVLDNYIDNTISPERYKRLLFKSSFKIEIKISLKSLDQIGKKTIDKYENLKVEFLKK